MRRLFAILIAVALVGFLTAGPAGAGDCYGAGWDQWGVYGTNWEAYGHGNYGYPYSGCARAYGYSWGGTDICYYARVIQPVPQPSPGTIPPAPPSR